MTAVQLFDLAKVTQFNLVLGDDSFEIRVEIFRSRRKPFRYRADVWRLELYRIQSTFPQREGVPSHEPSDEGIWVNWSAILRRYTQPFSSRSESAAEKAVIQEIEMWISHTKAECSSKPHIWRDCQGRRPPTKATNKRAK